jgi:Xaa-Pro aminopeptidase
MLSLIPSEDQHFSEYLAECDERRAFITGFTGSAGEHNLGEIVMGYDRNICDTLGTALVSRDSAMLFTDGRYFLQASQQLDQ